MTSGSGWGVPPTPEGHKGRAFSTPRLLSEDKPIEVKGITEDSRKGEDALLFLTFEIIGEVGGYTEITFSQMQVNEGDPAVESIAGGLEVTDLTASEIASFNPEEGATEASVDVPIVITFTDSIDTATLGYTCTLTPSCSIVTVTWNPISTAVTLEHTAPFTMQQVYTVSVTADDEAGNAMVVPYQWTFFTGKGEPLFLPLVTAESFDRRERSCSPNSNWREPIRFPPVFISGVARCYRRGGRRTGLAGRVALVPSSAAMVPAPTVVPRMLLYRSPRISSTSRTAPYPSSPAESTWA